MIQVDGIIYSLQRKGGVSVYTSQLLMHLERRRMDFCLSIDGPLKDPAALQGLQLDVQARPPRLQERYRKCRVLPQASVFHSIYYRKPSRSDIPTVVTAYDFVYEHYYSGLQRRVHSIQKYAAIRSAQVVLCISESTRDDLLEFVGPTPGQTIEVTHLAVSETFTRLAVEPAAIPYVLFVGERHTYKNFSTLLEALVFLPDLEIHCVGGGPLKDEEFINSDETVRRRVKHLGFVSDEDLNVHYNQAACLVYPSRYEGFGIPVLEGMRAGCPVVCIKCKAVLEIGRDALTVAEEDDPRALADAIQRVRERTYRNTIIQRGLEVASGYSWAATHDKTVETYRRLGAAGRSSDQLAVVDR